MVILPSKHMSEDRALLTVGAVILRHLTHRLTVSALWEQMLRSDEAGEVHSYLRYDAFVLALDLLFLVGAVELRDGLLVRAVL